MLQGQLNCPYFVLEYIEIIGDSLDQQIEPFDPLVSQ
jgi:hypothetical protein